MPPVRKNYAITSLLIFGVVCTVFGSGVIALPYWFLAGFLAHIDCGDQCASTIPSEHTVMMHAWAIVIGSTIIGLMPLLVYVIVTWRKHDDIEWP